MDEIENPTQESTTSLESLDKKETQGAKERETWSGKFDFFLSALGYAVGVGAVWRFPYLCYRNGGGVFLIPYFIFMALVGIPLVFLELGVGQFMSSGPLTCWKSVPIFRGIGLSMNVVNFITNLYYNMIMAYSLYYIVISLRAQLPWQFCDPSWRSPNCVDDYRPEHFNFTTCENSSFELKCPENGMCYNLTALDGTVANCSLNSSLLQPFGWFNPQFPSQDFWNNVILKKSSGIDETGSMIWQLLVAMIVAWIIIYAMVVRGIQVSGKLVYITAIFPYVILLILGIRGWTLPGASIGIDFYIRPDLSRLADINVWADAASQIFFTLSVAYGGLNSLASYNSFNANIMRDAVVISISNCFTSIFAGFVVFAFVGYLSHITGQRVDQVIQAGQGLSFVVFPFSVTTLPVAPLWSVLFFLMMLMLGMDTEMTGVETTITSVLDIFPSLRQSRVKKVLTITIICLLHFLCGLIFTFNSGTYWIEMLDYYAGNWAVFIVGAIESISIAWFYGLKNFHLDLSIMIGREKIYNKLFYYWDICWLVVSPVLLIILTVLVFIQTTPIQLSDYTFPYWSHILGQCITSLTLAGVVFWAIYTFFDYLFISRKPLINLIKADFEQWKPRKPEDQLLMRRAHGHNSMVMLFKDQDNSAMASTRF